LDPDGPAVDVAGGVVVEVTGGVAVDVAGGADEPGPSSAFALGIMKREVPFRSTAMAIFASRFARNFSMPAPKHVSCSRPYIEIPAG
jgi:hypothetical protein